MHFPFLAVPVLLPLRQSQMHNKCNTSWSTGRALTANNVTLRSGMETRHGTQVFSFLLMRRVSGLLINGCSKSEEIKGEEQLNREELVRGTSQEKRRLSGFL